MSIIIIIILSQLTHHLCWVRRGHSGWSVESVEWWQDLAVQCWWWRQRCDWVFWVSWACGCHLCQPVRLRLEHDLGLSWVECRWCPSRSCAHLCSPTPPSQSPSIGLPTLLLGSDRNGRLLHGDGPRTPDCGDTWGQRWSRWLGEKRATVMDEKA